MTAITYFFVPRQRRTTELDGAYHSPAAREELYQRHLPYLPMAQTLVMVQHEGESTLNSVLSPVRSPLNPPEASFITSTVRKRKPAPQDEVGDSKKLHLRQEATRRMSYGLGEPLHTLQEKATQAECHPISSVQQSALLNDAQPAGLEAACLASHMNSTQMHQQVEDNTETIFSPTFHLHNKDGEGAPAQQPGGSGEAPVLATPAPALCTDLPSRLLGSEGSELRVAGAEYGTEHVLCQAPANSHQTLHSPLVSPCKMARLPPRIEGGKSICYNENEEDAGLACQSDMACSVVATPAAPAVACDEDDFELEFDPLLFIKRLPPLEHCVPVRRTSVLLPRQTRRSKRKTLVLDLDETLVHSTLDGACRLADGTCLPDFSFPVEVGNVRHMVSVRQRPHLRIFLEAVARSFEVVVFTASQRVYAEQLLNVIDPGRVLIKHRVYRESCVFWEGNYLKDLTVLGRDLRSTVIVDNSPQAFGFQLDNGIPIESWFDDSSDEELLRLLPFLEQLAGADDVRPHIQNRFRLRQLVDDTPDPAHRLGALFG